MVEIVAEREAIRVIPDAEAYRVITRSPGLRLENEKNIAVKGCFSAGVSSER